ncbi:dihydroneopterin aldolase [Candidatus Desantisbacteria bacterium CG_4_10_14_0_8_um_filter_48_22]|uniref:7,8-dihydroneopterin aldolase n=1 Tax=Candidatus Desantisbacteria bacterium CG_4_10_14_0_8_um_filter_48_22 TaxID=1974543 RepID=A0A2M7SD66_9BACT|nr:MAG: dihydroneopterin aldolase [Candidatus Desantisbacteria bacterium CG1_02_49_89]PIV57374.1 MAG: dihydroneopterin aldolase [Candidatus Desantisbacteria bacterium CG02_land_8_20_14_3_00_49_13]PIZ17458.1 MAG: dihydroneopterin aldolase [Candidatus Desantisbacteria bacterium CG_4_10_14_0_8_um_filter_48_22]PJB27920.1 MAG: dihydroneopterin aldolase [Candidatus Desantisbacteria bacterium CG_4_9_14_3_um_filter_50_7]
MTKDKIILKGMSFYGYHGTSEIERRKGQRYYIDIEMIVDLEKAGRSDELSKTLDYKQACVLVKKIQGGKKYRLLEALAEDTAGALLDKFKEIHDITVKVRKPRPPVGGLIEYAEIEINRMQKPDKAWGSKIR